MAVANRRPLAATVDGAYEWCRRYTKARASNFYYAFSTLPAAKRNAIYAAYAFSGIVDDIADEITDPDEQELRFSEARIALMLSYEGRARLPSYEALSDAVWRFEIPRRYFDDLLAGVTMDITVKRYASWEELRVYCSRVASTIGLICTSIFGASEPVLANRYAIDLGIALQVINIMRDVREDAERGRIYMPEDELAVARLRDDDILGGIYDERFISLMRRQADRARYHLLSGRRLLPLLDVRSRMCVNVLQGVYAELLRRIETRNYDVFGERVRLSSREKLQAIAGLCLEAAIRSEP
ncbi:MAG TPA: squalene/phytoene synthase family protein [Dehalococcoidia bacterium]|nr:squalene/phytoene synthase family protein [Dehalococcoidia bacterium]